ncbi:hypothetical protein EB564_0005170 [Escherichia coli]|nr:hypothetical protein [Escherichia coli]MCZ6951792.1 hypothetical protein [Escherichia coli]
MAKTSCEENKVIDAMIYSGLYSSRASKIWRRDWRLDRDRDRYTPRACFLLSYARAHLNYGGLCGGGEIRAGRFPGYANPAQFTTRRLASSVVSY